MTDNGILQDLLEQKLKAQPWYKTYVNTAITVTALAVNVIWTLVSVGVNVDPVIIGSVAGFVQALGALGVKLAPNGVTPRQIKELEEYAGKHRKKED